VDLATGQGDAAFRALNDARKEGASPRVLAPLEAEVTLQIGQADKAITLLKALGPADAGTVHHVTGLKFFTMGNLPQAETELAQAHAIDPANCAYALDDAFVKARLGLFDAAIAEVTSLIQIRPRYMLGIMFIASTNAQKNDHAAALAAYQKALQVQPTNPEALTGAAEMYIALGQNAKARAMLDAADKAGGSIPRDTFLRGIIYGHEGQLDKALDLLMTSDIDVGTDADAADIAGNAYMKQNQPLAAVTDFQSAVQLRPDVPKYRLDLANAQLAFGDITAAKATMRALGEKFPAAPGVAQMQQKLDAIKAP
jgi:tetratricopeptide (TPR) repeat protein